jgi:hypothetical protein
MYIKIGRPTVATPFISPTAWWRYQREENPYGTFVSDSNTLQASGGTGLNLNGFGAPIGIGQTRKALSGADQTVIRRLRAGPFLQVATPYAASKVIKFVWNSRNVIGSTDLLFYMSNTDDHLGPVGWWNNTNNLLASFNVIGGQPFSIQIPTALLNTRAGSWASFILGTPGDFSSTTFNLDHSGALWNSSSFQFTVE